MHGRESVDRLYETFDIIKRFANDEEILFDNFNEYLEETKLKEKPINIWRNKIKTCKFDCWDCNYCDKVWLAKGNKVNEKISLVAKAVVDSINLPKINDIEGLTSDRTKKLLNALGKLSTSYLEIGVLNGATFCSVLKDNTLNAYAVDDWNHIVQAANGTTNIQSNKEKFISNVKKFKGNNKIKLFDSHFLNVDKSTIDYIDFMFYDADHSEELTRASVTYFSNKFTNNAILIFDDANFDGVVSGALKGIEDSGLKVLYQKIILNDIEDAEQWWNGLLIVVIGKD
jgi:hypothetical protein